MKPNIKKTGIVSGIVGATLLVSNFGAIKDAVTPTPPHVYQVIQWQKPTTDAGWAEDVKVESLNLRFDYQLEEMRTSHEAKLVKFLEDNEVTACPECIKFRLKKSNPEMTQAEIDALYAEQLAQYNWEVDKLSQSVERIKKEQELRRDKKVNRKQDILKIQPSTDKEKQELKKLNEN